MTVRDDRRLNFIDKPVFVLINSLFDTDAGADADSRHSSHCSHTTAIAPCELTMLSSTKRSTEKLGWKGAHFDKFIQASSFSPSVAIERLICDRTLSDEIRFETGRFERPKADERSADFGVWVLSVGSQSVRRKTFGIHHVTRNSLLTTYPPNEKDLTELRIPPTSRTPQTIFKLKVSTNDGSLGCRSSSPVKHRRRTPFMRLCASWRRPQWISVRLFFRTNSCQISILQKRWPHKKQTQSIWLVSGRLKLPKPIDSLSGSACR